MLSPEAAGSRAGECLAFNEAGGFRFFEWQRLVVSSWLGTGPDGLWAAKSCAAHVPRQNGKTLGTTVPRMCWGACALNELVLYTSHLQKTSTETFEYVAAFFDQPKFRKYLKAVRTALGREAVEFRGGGKVKFLARTRNGGRGQHADLLVFDEDQELTDEQQASFKPCLSASRNPQTLYTGTPPDENAPGTVARRIRARALSGTPGLAYAEWGVGEIGDVFDRDRWYAANPSLGVLILESTMESEAADMAPDKFAREHLGWWAPTEATVEHVVDAGAWAARMVDAPPPLAGSTACAGVKFGPDRSTLAYCVRPPAGPAYVEWVDTRPLGEGVGWVADWLDGRRASLASVAIDGRSGAGALATRLADRGFPSRAVVVCGPADAARANSTLVDAVNDGGLSHLGQDGLNASATATARRRIGQDGIGFEDSGGADATIVEACALALWQAMTTKRNPTRRARVS